MGTDSEVRPNIIVVVELTLAGFGELSVLGGLFVRLFAVNFAAVQTERRILFQIVPITTSLRPTKKYIKYGKIKWWKSPTLSLLVRQIVYSCTELSAEVPRSFMVDAKGKIVPGSIKKLRTL